MIYDFLDENSHLSPLVKDKQFRSKTVIVAKMDQSTENLLNFLKTKGMIVGSGYGAYKNDHIRIANFPGTTITDIKKLIKCLKQFTR